MKESIKNIHGSLKNIHGSLKKQSVEEYKYSENFNKIINIINKNNLKFIQVGAYDGVSGDPIHNFIKDSHWHGILIEPHLSSFELLLKNYENQEGLIFENAAIHPNLKEANLYIGKKRSTSSLSRRSIRGKRSGVEKVKCFRLSQIIEKHNFFDFDLLQVDAEGLDYQIIKTLDFTKTKPRVIHYEHTLIDSNACDKFLKKMGYSILKDQRDTTAYLV